MADWFSNGKPVEHVAINDRGFQYGDGLFETIAIRDGKPRLWNYHLDRLARGCQLLGLRLPADSELSDGMMQAVQQGGAPADHCVAKIIVSAGFGQRGYGRAPGCTPLLFFGAFLSVPSPMESYRDGIDTFLCRTRLASNSATAGVKTLNRLEQVLARSEFADTDLFEGLVTDADGNIICGTMSNVFFVNDNSISTPSLDSCGVEGVMRRHVIATLREKGIDTEIGTINLSELKNFDEVFVANSQFGVMPVKSCMELHWTVGDVTRRVMAHLADNGVLECR